METERLRQFRVLVEQGSLTAASIKLGLSPSGLSKSMRQLSNELKLTLFEPEGRGLRITDAGQKIYEDSGPILERISALGKLSSPTFKGKLIGGMEAFTHFFIGEVLMSKLPEEKFVITELRAGEIEKELLQSRLDIGITYFPRPSLGLEQLAVRKIKLEVCAHQNFFNQGLQNLSFVLPQGSEDPHFTEFIDQDGWPEFERPRASQIKTNRLSTALELVKKNPLAIVIPEFIRNRYDFLRPINLPKDFSNLERTVYLVWKQENEPQELIELFFSELRKL